MSKFNKTQILKRGSETNHTPKNMAISLYNAKFILLISASFITIFSSIAIYFCLPILLSHLIRQQLTLSPTSGSFNDWKLNHVVDRMYLYNITNALDLIEASRESARLEFQRSRTIKTKPKLSQIGPFAFKQVREKLNISFEPQNETVIYDQKKSWHLIPEDSIIKSITELDKFQIYHMNIPLCGSILKDPKVFSEVLYLIVVDQNLNFIINHTAQELLFEGYLDTLMEQGKQTGEVDIDRFGWMYNLNNSITSNFRIFTGPSNATLDKFGSVDQFNHEDRLDVWYNQDGSKHNVRCNEFKHSSAGEFFPPPQHSIISHNSYRKQLNLNDDKPDDRNPSEALEKGSTSQGLDQSSGSSASFLGNGANGEYSEKMDRVISIFMPDICRTYQLYYNRTLDYKGLTVDRYIANEFTYNYAFKPSKLHMGTFEYSRHSNKGFSNLNPNSCYCRYDEATKTSSCPPNGLMELFQCKRGNPLVLSFPYFLYSTQDPSLAPYLSLFSTEIQANEEEHQFFMDLESSLNLPIRAQVPLQFNVNFKNEPGFNFTLPFSYLFHTHDGNMLDSLYLPQMWIQSRAEVDETNLRNLKFLQHNLKLITPIVTLIFFVLASVLLAMSAKMAYDLTYGPSSRKGSNAQWAGDTDQCRGEREDMLASHEMAEMSNAK